MLMFKFTSAVCDSFVDVRVSRCLKVASSSMKLIFGIMIMISFLFIIAITLMIKIGGNL